jgi:DNA-binding transcriptional LysR family regulator
VTLDQLLAFQAVAKRGGFSAASAHLHKSQPAITKLVQNLEEELGVVLFDRSSYRAALTDAGRLFLERAESLLERSDALVRYGRSLGGSAEVVVRLVLEAVTPLPCLLAALRETQARFPAVRYELRTERLTGVLEALSDGEADLVIAGRHGLDPQTMVAQRYGEVRIVPVVHRDHPLAAIGGPVPATELRQYAQVVLTDSTRGELTQTMNVLDGGQQWTVTDVAAKLEILEAGLGWGGLPAHVVAAPLAAGRLAVLDVREFAVGSLELFSIRRRDEPVGPVIEALWTRLAQPCPPPRELGDVWPSR